MSFSGSCYPPRDASDPPRIPGYRGPFEEWPISFEHEPRVGDRVISTFRDAYEVFLIEERTDGRPLLILRRDYRSGLPDSANTHTP